MNAEYNSKNHQIIINQLLSEGNFLKATLLYKKAYDKFKNDIAFYLIIALYYHTYMSPEEALVYYDEIIKKDENCSRCILWESTFV